jgi:hypothetical protein
MEREVGSGRLGTAYIVNRGEWSVALSVTLNNRSGVVLTVGAIEMRFCHGTTNGISEGKAIGADQSVVELFEEEGPVYSVKIPLASGAVGVGGVVSPDFQVFVSAEERFEGRPTVGVSLPDDAHGLTFSSSEGLDRDVELVTLDVA